MDLEAAKEDLNIRTLGPIGYDFGRLVYLSSLRDHSSGEYHHHGLARSFSHSVASIALEECHRDVFYQLIQSPLAKLVNEVERFVRSSGHDFDRTVRVWENLEAYRKLSAESNPAKRVLAIGSWA